MEKNVYDDREFIDFYFEMVKDYDNSFVVNNFKNYVKKGCSVLELGMGPALDYDALKDEYNFTVSDTSQIFIDIFNQNHQSKAINVCAKSIDVNEKYDCIFSNKVLQVLEDDEIKESFINQHKALNDNGVIVHCIWIDEKEEKKESNYTTLKKLNEFIKDLFTIVDIIHYSEMEDDDSIILVAKKIE